MIFFIRLELDHIKDLIIQVSYLDDKRAPNHIQFSFLKAQLDEPYAPKMFEDMIFDYVNSVIDDDKLRNKPPP